MARVQSALDDAYEKNDQKRIQRYEEALSKAQAQIQQWQDQRDAVLNGAGQVAALPATTVTGTGPTTKTPFTPSGGEDKRCAPGQTERRLGQAVGEGSGDLRQGPGCVA